MTCAELIAILSAMPPTLEVIVSSQGETVQIPIECKVEPTCVETEGGEAEEIVRLYTDNGERD